MNRVFIIAIALFTCKMFSQNVNIPNASFKTALIIQGNIDTNYDGEIQTNEALAFTGEIHVPGWGITDLTGIEAFINLSGLGCSDNGLTSLNLSANTALIKLDCHGNSLPNLDLSSNIILEDLNCYNTQLTSLNLSTNTALKILNLTTNNIVSIDLSTNIALENLIISHNNIEELDLTANTQLTSFVGTNINELTSINIANNNNTYITTFDARNNTNLDCIQVDDENYSSVNWLNINGSTVFKEDCSSLSIPENNFVLRFYPNPTTNYLHIEVVEETDYNIVSLQGQIVKSGKLLKRNNILDVSILSQNVYLMQLKTASGKSLLTRFVKK